MDIRNIFGEAELGRLHLKNRIFMAPLKTAFGTPDGRVTDGHLNFYKSISRGGTAAIILEPTAVLLNGKEHPKQLCIHEDRHIAELKKITEVIHSNNALVGCHLNHAGRAANPKATETPPLAPTKMTCPSSGAEAKELTDEQIQEIITAYGDATRRAVESGFDFIEVQAGHGYLISQFYSSRTNQRNDHYGDSIENRLRFAKEVFKQVNDNAGVLPLIARISGKEFVEGGLDVGDLGPLIELIEESGFAALHIGYGNVCDSPPWYFNHMALPEQPQFDILRAIRGVTDLPLIAAGRMGYPDKVQKVIGEGLADFIALGRPLLADPELPSKWESGREEEITYCGACLQGCLTNVKSGNPIGCIVNAEVGTEPLVKAGEPKKVMVVGAGPAGISAAVTLSRCGHMVTLYDQSDTPPGGCFPACPQGTS